MAVKIEFLNLIIPIEKINEFYPGGFEGFKRDNQDDIGCRILFDDYILRDGAMDPMSLKSIAEKWIELGLQPVTNEDGETKFKDICIVDCSYESHSTLPCDWLNINDEFVSHVDDK